MWIYITIALLALIIIFAAVIYHDTHNFIVRHYEISTDKIKGEYTFAFLTDLHDYTFGKDNEKLLAAVDDIKPDAILCAGDMFVASEVEKKKDVSIGEHVLVSLAAKYPVYAANGNHEENIKSLTKELGNFFDRYRSRLKKAGVIYLENESADIDGTNIRITGLDLPHEYFRKVIKKQMEEGYLDRKLGQVKGNNQNKFNLLIAHNPQYFKDYSKWGADLTVSGHVHGGIMRLPLLGGVISPAVVLFPKYSGGKYEHDGHTMILSCGLGTHTIHVRVFNPGEISVIKIRGTK